MHDNELPRGFQDSDFEQAELESIGNIESQLKKQGICTHGWTQGHSNGSVTCLECKFTFKSQHDLNIDRNSILADYL